jgi:flagellar hook-associated protein 3 FlgL
MMRVTQGMLSNNMLRNLSNSYAKFDTYFDQLNTGKKISRPSQDPVIAMKGINYRTQVAEVAQHKRNVNEAHQWMDNSDAALDKATQAVQRLRELAIQAANDTYDEQERKSIKEEAEQLKEHLIDLANTSVNGKYIFNGINTKVPLIGTEQNSDGSGDVFIEVAQGSKLKVNVNGADVFGEELFMAVDDFIQALDSDTERDFDKSIGELDEQVNNIIDARAELGARMNRLELVENRLSEQEIIAKKTMSENEDIDFEEAITNLLTQESLHAAALAAGSKIIQPSLMDFLR